MVWSSVRLVRMGMPLTDDPERLLISNSRCSVTSSSPCNRGVAFTFNPRSTYSADGYAVCPAAAADDVEGRRDDKLLSVTVTEFEVGLSFATMTSNELSPFKSAATKATGSLPVGIAIGELNVRFLLTSRPLIRTLN